MNVSIALRGTSKGKLIYDKYWVEEGRVKEILDDVSEFSSNIKLPVSPKILSQILSNSTEVEHLDTCEVDCTVKVKATKPNSSTDITDAYFYELQSELESPILEYEEGRLKYMLDKFKSKQNEYEHHSKEILQQIEQEYQFIKRKNELDSKRRLGDLEKFEEETLKLTKERELLQKEHYQTQAKKLSAKIFEAEMKQKKAEEELKKREQEQLELRVQLSNCQKEAQNIVSKSLERLNSCEHLSYLKITANDHINMMKQLLQNINLFVEDSIKKSLTIDDIQRANNLCKTIYEAHQNVMYDTDQAKVRALQEQVAHVQNYLKQEISVPAKFTTTETIGQAHIRKDMSKSEVSTVVSAKKNDGKPILSKDKQSEEAKKIIAAFIAPDAVESYHTIVEHLKCVESKIQPFINDSRNKKYRFELQKSVNVPINAISSVSGSHVRDKINRLLSILGGKMPESHGSESNSDSFVYNFCANLIAKQFVEQGDRQISAQYSTAFPIAMAVVGVWIKKPEIGNLILGHFYRNCPYLVPFYPPRKEGQSDQDYYESLGYHFDREGNMEEKYKFLNRISGYMRLYAAIIQSPLPPNSKSAHPHGIPYGWKWLARTLNMDPRVDVTATLVYNFLDVTGHELQKYYGKQFKKFLHILCKGYFQKIKKVTPGGSGGPIERLETFLQQTAKKGYVSPPEGILESGFWNR